MVTIVILWYSVSQTFLSQNSSVDHLTLVPFESKFINSVAYFYTSTFTVVADRGDGLQKWRIAANILNKQSRTASGVVLQLGSWSKG